MPPNQKKRKLDETVPISTSVDDSTSNISTSSSHLHLQPNKSTPYQVPSPGSEGSSTGHTPTSLPHSYFSTPAAGGGAESSSSGSRSGRSNGKFGGSIDARKLVPGDIVHLEGYRDVRVLSVHYDDTIACRAISIARGDQKVFLKFSLSAKPSTAAQFKAEATLLSDLSKAGVRNVTQTLAREVSRNGSVFVVADEGFRLLHEVYLTNRPPTPRWQSSNDLLRALDHCLRLVRLVSSIHALSIIHGSIRPTTITLSVFNEIHLHDFSAAFRFGPDGDSSPIRERGMHEESLPYLAPECSGRVGKTVDYRSDYYSIGATLYQIFTGRTPFAEFTDPLELIHAHIAKRPSLMSTYDDSIPHELSLLVAKLLEKAPEERYQTSLGLVVDLEKVSDLVRARAVQAASDRDSMDIDTPTFIVGSVDEAAHFRLPPSNMLFGRDESTKRLKATYKRVEESGTSEVVIVKGHSGIGKTSLVETVRKPVAQAKGYYTSVKFDQIKSPVPFFAISQALSGLLRQILSESSSQLVVWQKRISKVLGKEARIVADVVPSLENIFEKGWIDTLPEVVPLSPAQSEERFQGLVQKLLKAFAREKRPLVIVFDDLQWSTPSDLTFIINLLAEDHTSASMLLICLYRDNEVDADHIVSTTLLPALKSALTIALKPLTAADVRGFIKQSLRRPRTVSGTSEKAEDRRDDPNLVGLSELMLRKTEGSPLFIAQLLKALNSEGLFTFNFDLGRWTYDLDLIAAKSYSTDVVDLLQDQMRKFGIAAQEVLKVAACIGNEEISISTLARASSRSIVDLVRDMTEPIESGLVVPIGEMEFAAVQPVETNGKAKKGKEKGASVKLTEMALAKVPEAYRFFHDRCQQAAYSLVPPTERSAMHYSIGQRLVATTSPEAITEQIFDLANQLNHGIEILTTTEERDNLARYNQIAGTRANKSTAFEAARKYYQIAWDLLGAGWTTQYDLMSTVTEGLIDVEHSLADYAAAQEYVRVYLANSRHNNAKLRVFAKSIRCATATGAAEEAIAIGREALAMVDIEFPSSAEAAADLVTRLHSEEQLVTLTQSLEAAGQLTDTIAAGAQAIMAALVPPVYFVRIDLLGALSSLAIQSIMNHGMGDSGAFMLTLHAVLIAGQFNDHPKSLAMGALAIGYFDKHGGTPLACPAFKVYASHIGPWAMPIRDTLPAFHRSVAYGIEFRDGEYLGFGSSELCAYSIFSGVNLLEVCSQVEQFSVLVRKFRNELSVLYLSVTHQASLNLIGRSAHPIDMDGEAYSHMDHQITKDKNYGITLHLYHLFRSMLAMFYGDRARARDSLTIGREYIDGAQGLVFPAIFQLFEAVFLYEEPSLSVEEKDRLEETSRKFDALAGYEPSNYGHMRLWLKAEDARSRGSVSEAIDFYDQAIEAATEAKFVHLAAFMNERCSAIMRTSKLAAGYLFEAYAQWKSWGCVPKLQALAAEHPLLFSSTLSIPPANSTLSPALTQHAHPPDTRALLQLVSPSADAGSSMHDPTDTDAASSHRQESHASEIGWINGDHKKTSGGSHGSRGSHSGGVMDDILSERSTANTIDVHNRSHLATELDLRTVVTASSVIGMEGSVDGVVAKLLALALRTAGAEQCLLVLEKSGNLCAEATVNSDSGEVKHLRRLDSIDSQPEKYPCSVINYVARTRSMVVNDLDALGDAISDPYLDKKAPKSILCLALASQSRVVGVLYLENSQTANAFTPDRLEILSLISGQAASTVEKARLVQDLKSANIDLTRSQAALEGYNRNLESTVTDRTLELRDKNNRLLAEIAEKELAQAEMRSAKDVAEAATQMKSQFLANMSHEIRTPFNAVVALTGLLLDTPLNPVQTDYVETIKNSSHELLVVINDILDYSKIELDHLELSKETVQLRNALESSMDMVAERAASKSVELALVLEQGDIDIVTDLTRLRQIVVNLLSNAVKFTSDGDVTVTASADRLPFLPGEEPMTRVKISVKDCGIGIPEKDFGKLFKVFSQVDGSETTKNFGGTGLGLAISRKLSKLMGGDITVESEVGVGSTFTVDFLAPSAEPPKTDHYSPAQNSDLVGRRCLIVDANATGRQVLGQLTTSFGLEATVPEDPGLAYAMAVEAHESGKAFDLVIIDAFLPGFAAQTLLRRLRQKNINTPAIALTRMGSPIHDALRQLDCAFLIKPIKRNRLHHTLRLVFPSGESRKNTPAEVVPTSTFPTNLAARLPLAILCAEDNPINVKVITHLLKRMGYSTDIAENGLVAVEKAQKKRYDIILMDCLMPEMGGLEATRKLVELIPDPNIRPYIVAMTANAMSGDRENCLAAGCQNYVSKPILVPDLVGALTEAGARAQKNRAAQPLLVPGLAADGGLPFELELPAIRRRKSPTVSSANSTGSNSTPQSPKLPPSA